MTIYFLGAGNMASAIIAGMSRAGGFDICAIDHSADKLATLAQQYGIATAPALPPLNESDVLVLAVKPQDMRAACADVQTNAGGAAKGTNGRRAGIVDCRRAAMRGLEPLVGRYAPHCAHHAEHAGASGAGCGRLVCRQRCICG